MSAGSLVKFVILTRGRTGSTAIIDEIDRHQNIFCCQELFINLRAAPDLYSLYKKHGVSFEEYGFHDKWFPIFALWSKQFKKSGLLSKAPFLKKVYSPANVRRASRYLNELESRSVSLGYGVVGFKLLEHQVAEIPGFMALLKGRGYKMIYLERKNVVRQVLSGVIANKRNKFNTKNYVSDGRLYELDLNHFKKLIKGELREIQSQKRMIERQGFDSLSINYEDFLNKRPAFFKRIFEFLGVENVLPEQSDFSIMVPNVKDVVKNYDEFYACIEGMGMREYIES
jgi:hypothetical protein